MFFLLYIYNLFIIFSGQKIGIKKCYFYHTEEMLRGHPEFFNRASPSIDARMDIMTTAVPELASVAAAKAIAEWGRPAAEITHLIVSTYSSGGHMPGADFRLASLLGLPPSVQRTMLYMYGCTSMQLRSAPCGQGYRGEQQWRAHPRGVRGPHAHALSCSRRQGSQ